MALLSYLLLGCISGTLAGLLGVGGGLVIVPALIFLFHQQGFSDALTTHMAVGTSLATIVLTSISSVRVHHAHRAVQWRLFRYLSTGIVTGALLGAVIAHALQATVLQAVIGLFAMLVSAQMAFDLKPKAQRALPGKPALWASGNGIGLLSSLFGIGGGSITVPLLTYFSVPIQQAVATSAACGLPIALAGSVGFVLTGWSQAELPAGSLGYVYLPAFMGIVASSVFFAILGARLAHRLPAAVLKKLFALLLLGVGVQLLTSAL